MPIDPTIRQATEPASSGTAFGAWLRQRRNALGLAQKELAEQAGCSAVTIEKIESGKRRPSSQVAEMLARCFDVPADECRAFVEFARARVPAESRALLDDAGSRSPWRILYKHATNLPSPVTAFIGREQEVEAACALLKKPGVRLLSMTGPPGIGKTRLSLRVAEGLLEYFESNIYFVGLAPVRDPDLVIPSIAHSLNLREAGGESLLENLKQYLGDKRTLLVLDNFEQVVAAAPQVGELLTAAPWLKVLISSREMLHIYGEHEFPVHPLDLPRMKHLPPVERLIEYEAVRLFTERAVAVRPDFVLTADNAQAVVDICNKLDKVPLAIELAAARARTLQPSEIVRRLNSNFELLTGGARDLPARQRALRSAIDWSYDLLNEEERQLFRRISVFVGGCSLQAVEAVCGPQHADDQHFAEALYSLVDKNLVRQEESNGEMRFSMLETIREYAWGRLVGRGEDVDIRRLYGEYYKDLADRAKSAMKGSGQLGWLDRLELEHNNLRAVLRYALDSGDAETALQLSGALWKFWLTHGHLTEGRRWLMEALKSEVTGQDAMLTNALNGAGNLACASGDFHVAQPLYERSLEIRRRQGDRPGIAGSLNNLALTANSQCDYARVMALHEESLAIKREMGDKWGIASSLGNLGIAMADQGDYASARKLHEESLEIRRELEDSLGVALSLLNLGIVVLTEEIARERPENLASAQSLFDESLAIRRELADRPGIAECLVRLGELEHCKGNYSKAGYLYQQSLEICRELGDKSCISSALLNLGHLDLRHGNPGQASVRFKENLVLQKQLNDTRGVIESLAAWAGVAAAFGEPAIASHLFGATEALLQSTDFHLYAVDLLEYRRNTTAVRAKLGDNTWEKRLAEGALISPREATDLALKIYQQQGGRI